MESFSYFLQELAQKESSVFYLVLFLSAAAFLIAETTWLTRQLKSASRTKLLDKLPEDDARFGIFWTLIPVLVLLVLVFSPSALRSKDRALTAREKKSPSEWSERLRKRWMRENAAVIKNYDR